MNRYHTKAKRWREKRAWTFKLDGCTFDADQSMFAILNTEKAYCMVICIDFFLNKLGAE